MSESSNPLALYKGQVKLKIDSNWKIPLGIEQEREIQVAFLIFSEVSQSLYNFNDAAF